MKLKNLLAAIVAAVVCLVVLIVVKPSRELAFALPLLGVVTSKELREKRKNIATQMSDLVKKDKLSSEDEQSFDRMEKEERELKVQIDRLERVEDLNRDLDTVRNPLPGASREEREQRGGNNEESEKSRTEKRSQAFYEYCRHGVVEMRSELKPYLFELRTTTPLTTQTGATGGYTVPQGFDANFIKVLKDFNGVRQAGVSVLTTAGGNDIPVPKIDDTANVGEIVGENVATADDEIPTFGQVTLKAANFSSKEILIPIQLLQDSAVDMEVELPNMAGERIARCQATYFTTGNGTGQPQGIVTGSANSAVVGAGADYLPTFLELMDFIHTVDPAYRADPSCGFMFHDTNLKGLKKLKDDENRPLWLPGLAVKEPDTINGYRYTINQAMAAPASNVKSMLFGAMRYYRIRDVRGVTVMRLAERHAEKFQVAFLAFQRSDGRMLNSAAIKYFTTKT